MGDMQIHIGEMLARNARMFPEKIALVERISAEGQRFTITWREFDSRANSFSQVLRGMGIQKGDRVMQLMNNSIDWLVAYFGIVRTGAWVVPLNFRFIVVVLIPGREATETEILEYCQEIYFGGLSP